MFIVGAFIARPQYINEKIDFSGAIRKADSSCIHFALQMYAKKENLTLINDNPITYMDGVSVIDLLFFLPWISCFEIYPVRDLIF